jgi:lysine-N-methylase
MTVSKALNPEYVKNFNCIGSDCEDTCCAGWGIMIDRKTYKKYKKIKDEEFKQIFNTGIKRIKENPSDKSYAVMNLNEKNQCHFLTKEGLCKIHRDYGESYLCTTCSVYPRVTNYINNIFETSLTPSCPEAARLILLNSEGITFEFIETSEEVKYVANVHHDKTSKDSLKNYFSEIRRTIITILQDNRYDISERLILMGMLSERLEMLYKKFEPHQVSDVLKSYLLLMDKGIDKSFFEELTKKEILLLDICNILMSNRLKHEIKNDRYVNVVEETLEGLQLKGVEHASENHIKIYRQALEKYYNPFISKHHYIFENYLVNQAFSACIPFDKDTIFKSYIKFIIQFVVLKIHFVGVGNFNQGLNKDIAVRIISSFSRSFQHNPTFMNRVYEFLFDNKITSLEAITKLLRS